jgi:hypothetical protein
MGSAYSTNTFTCHPSQLSAPGVLIVRGKLSELYAEMRVFGHLPACNWIAKYAGGGGLGGHRIFAARNKEVRAKPKHGAFGFRFSWSRGHARQNLWPYMRRDITLSGGLVVLNHCEGLRQEVLLPTPYDLLGRAFLGSQGSCFNGF